MGQPPTNPDGNMRLWGGSAYSRHVFDWYTRLPHRPRLPVLRRALAGRAALAASTSAALVALVVEAAWEVVENTPWVIDRYRDVTVSGDYVGDTVINSVFDLWAMLVGFWLAARLAGLADGGGGHRARARAR